MNLVDKFDLCFGRETGFAEYGRKPGSGAGAGSKG